MTATVRSTGVGNSAAATALTFTPAMPVGFAAGDLLIGVACNGSGTPPSATPSGSTNILNVVDGTVYNMDVCRKVAVGGDVFTWTIGVAQRWSGCVIAITAGTWDTVTPIAGASGLAQGTVTTATFTSPSSTPTSADSLMIAMFGVQAAATWTNADTAPTMTEICDTGSSGTAPSSTGVYRSNAPPAVALITRTGTSSVASANGARAQMFVNPGAAAEVRLPRRQRPQLRR